MKNQINKIQQDGKFFHNIKVGDVFTPIDYAKFMIEKFKIFDQWLQGATVFDPTMGEGNLLEALVLYGIDKGYKIEKLPIQNLFGNELNTEYYTKAISKFQKVFSFDMSKNFTQFDILTLNPKQYEILFGNPPWQNYVDLPEKYKTSIRQYFIDYDLVENPKSLLLGGSRIDISALIVQCTIKNFLKSQGNAYFFLPLSLFLNDGAHKNFRNFNINETQFSVEKIYDFKNKNIFNGIATRYGFVHFIRDKKNEFPIDYHQFTNQKWKNYNAIPLFLQNDPLSIINKNKSVPDFKIKPIYINKESTPRQGINTCGANHVFFFDTLIPVNNDSVLVANKYIQNIKLPVQFVVPLITSKDFKNENTKPSKWVLFPYNYFGKPLIWEQIEKYKDLKEYLLKNQNVLQNRKGILLNASLNRGFWWALLGVGKYSFSPYKIVWEAYGKKTFNPKIFKGLWQPNQALQAFIPLYSKRETTKIYKLLLHKNIEKYLLSLKMENTMNWAQPGKIKKLCSFVK